MREFEHGEPPRESPVLAVDHISLTQPWQVVEESTLFYTAGFALSLDSRTDVPGPRDWSRAVCSRRRTGRSASR